MAEPQQNDIESVVETKQLSSVDGFILRDIDIVLNEYLKLGWRIIDRWTVGNRHSGESQHLCVLVGWHDANVAAPHPTLQEETERDPW